MGWHFLDPGLLLSAWVPLALKSKKKEGRKVSPKRGRLQEKQTKRDKKRQRQSPRRTWLTETAVAAQVGDVHNICLNSGGGQNKRGGRWEGEGY